MRTTFFLPDAVRARRAAGLLLVSLSLFATSALRAQPAPAAVAAKIEIPPIGPVTLAEFAPAAFVADSGAAAVVLSDFGRTSFLQEGPGFKVRFERTRRVKILRAEGLEEATIKIQLYHRDNGFEKLTSLKGTAWNADGGKLQKTETKSTAGTTVRISDYVDERRLTLADARVGSVVEIGYVTTSDFIFELPTWWFEEEGLPVRRTELRVEIPQFFDYAMEFLSYYPFALEEQSQRTFQAMTVNGQQVKATSLRWVMLNVPAFRDERFITTPEDYMAHMRFQLRATNMPGAGYQAYSTSWKSASAELLLHPRFGEVIGIVGDLSKPLRDLRDHEPDLPARAKRVVGLVRDAVAWNGRSGIYTTGPLTDALRQHTGNVAEVNLLLVGALRTAGIEADPVILSTRDHGTVPEELPLLDRFNFVLALARLPGQTEPVLLDASTPYAPHGMLPERCLGTRGRVIVRDEQDQRWVPVKATHQYTSFTSGTISPDGKGGTTAALHVALTGYAAQRARRRAEELTAEKLTARYITPAPGARITRQNLNRPNDPTQPVTLEVEVTDAAEAGAAPPALVFIALKEFGGMAENPFPSPERRFPVDLGSPLNETLMLDVTVPAGYVIETVPAPLNLRSPDGHVRAQFRCTPAEDGRSVQISSALLLTRTAFEPQEYSGLRTIYSSLVAKHAEPLVLKQQGK